MRCECRGGGLRTVLTQARTQPQISTSWESEGFSFPSINLTVSGPTSAPPGSGVNRASMQQALQSTIHSWPSPYHCSMRMEDSSSKG